MQDRVGQLWEVSMFSASTINEVACLVLVVASNLEEGMHRLLVIDPGMSGWKAGDVRTHGELVEWPNSSIGTKRVA